MDPATAAGGARAAGLGCGRSGAGTADPARLDSLTDPLSGQTREALEDYSPASQTDPASAILDIFKWASNLSVGTLREAVQTGAMLLTAALICQLVRQAYPKDRLQLQSLTGAFAITVLFAASMKSMIGLATGVLDEMEAYAKLLLRSCAARRLLRAR